MSRHENKHTRGRGVPFQDEKRFFLAAFPASRSNSSRRTASGPEPSSPIYCTARRQHNLFRSGRHHGLIGECGANFWRNLGLKREIGRFSAAEIRDLLDFHSISTVYAFGMSRKVDMGLGNAHRSSRVSSSSRFCRSKVGSPETERGRTGAARPDYAVCRLGAVSE